MGQASQLAPEELECLLHPQQLCRVPRAQRVQLGLLQRRLQRPLLGVQAEEAPRQRVHPDRCSAIQTRRTFATWESLRSGISTCHYRLALQLVDNFLGVQENALDIPDRSDSHVAKVLLVEIGQHVASVPVVSDSIGKTPS